MRQMLYTLKLLASLGRWGVSFAVGFSAATAYIVAASGFDSLVYGVMLGVFFMSAGASALNQYQEKKIDALMVRTQKRAIPSGKVSEHEALIIALLLICFGVFILFLNGGWIPTILGLTNLLWYNLLYTSLKKKTAFAVVPGSITGVIPVLIGWTSYHSWTYNPTIVFIACFIYLWQVPHFWLLHVRYVKDYRNAGLGNLQTVFSQQQAKRIIFSWLVASSLASMLFPYFEIIRSEFLSLLLIAANFLILITLFRSLFFVPSKIKLARAFRWVNIFMFFVMLILIVESLLLN